MASHASATVPHRARDESSILGKLGKTTQSNAAASLLPRIKSRPRTCSKCLVCMDLINLPSFPYRLECGKRRHHLVSDNNKLMALSLRVQRHILRFIVLLVAVFFIFHTYATASSATINNEPTNVRWSDRIWKATTRTARKLVPVEYSNTQLPLTPNSGHERVNATFVSLVRNSELEGMLRSIQDVEDRFNRNWHYDWVFLNDEDFTEEFVRATTTLTSGRARFGKVPKEHWRFPDNIDKQRAEAAREEMKNVTYGGSESYRHMCRWQSGFFYRHPLVLDYDWYWRVEPSISISCDITYDPFRWMAENGKQYGFVISLNEVADTVPGLWMYTKEFMKAYPEHISEDNHLSFLSEDGGETSNYCHFWSNFEIASLDFFRSKAYNDYFDYLDSTGGFFYERWGDASVHSIAASLMLRKGGIHFFDDIGYGHSPLQNCPRSEQKRIDQSCSCSVESNMVWSPSCTKRFFEVSRIPFPDGYDTNVTKEPGVLS